MREIWTDRLYLATSREAHDLKAVLERGVLAVIDLAADEPPLVFPRDIICCRFPLIDGEGNPIILLRTIVETGVALIRAAIPTLICCGRGMSRSVAVASAILARANGITADASLRQVAGAGPHDLSPALWAEVKAACFAAPPSDGMEFLAAAIKAFESNKQLAERAMAQIPQEKLHCPLDENTNSIAVIAKHVGGNLRSRWTDFLTTDGEKPDRNRDDEFVDSFATREEIMRHWQVGWDCLFATLRNLTAGDLATTVFVRGEPHSVALALERSLAHTCYHLGQIVLLARHFAGEQWQTLTIPRGESERFNREHWQRQEPRRSAGKRR